MRGRTPTPTEILKARGTFRADRRRKDEPQPERIAPKCPDHLSKEAKVEWRRMVKLLLPAGLLTIVDGEELALYCCDYARWVEAEKRLAEDGVIVRSPNGYPITSPYWVVSNKAMAAMRHSLAKFGMTPADRARVHVAPAPKIETPKPAQPVLRIAQ